MKHKSPTIVAIDDNKDNLVALKAFVSDAFPGASVFSALNGRHGIELVREKDPDVILLDILMPGMDGFEVCRQLKADPDLSHIPVVFLTALKDDKKSRIRALEVGGEAFISKPFDEAELTAQIRAMVKIKAANEREWREKERLAELVAERTSQLETELAERKLAENTLHRVNQKLNLLSSITRHDISNQLTILTGYLTILEKQQPDTSFSDYFLRVSTAAKRISAMIQFTKEYEEIGVHAPVWQDCRTLVDTAAKQAPLGMVVVKNDLPAGMEVFADPLVVKVFYNLMDNAARYGGKITTIRFSIEESGDDHLIVCEDDGDGIVTGEKEMIFERGFGKNTGLGLALSREILSITGIAITETGGPGKGARFEMAVPKGAWRYKEESEEPVA
jgi:CheY-like chemotaxis protein/two-component sensor histidine kinase